MLATQSPSRVAEKIEHFVDRFSFQELDAGCEHRRQTPRYAMAEPVDLLIDSTETPADLVMASGRDISAGGNAEGRKNRVGGAPVCRPPCFPVIFVVTRKKPPDCHVAPRPSSGLLAMKAGVRDYATGRSMLRPYDPSSSVGTFSYLLLRALAVRRFSPP